MSLISVVKALIVTKIDFALPFFGTAPKSVLNKVNSTLHSAIRIALGALRSTPSRNLLFEANIAPLAIRQKLLTTNLFTCISNSADASICNIVKKYKTPKGSKKLSVLDKIIDSHKHLEIQLNPSKKHIQNSPPWTLNQKAVNTSLSYLNKNVTSPETFRKEFARIQTELNSNKMSFIYTDGSQIKDLTGFAVTTNSSILKMGILPTYSSVYTAEIIAIYEAIMTLKTIRGKYIICSDSLSSLNAIKNTSNHSYYATEIRNLLIRNFPKFTLLWIPSHVNITGNEFADLATKNALRHPLVYTINLNCGDIKKYVSKYFNSLSNDTFLDISVGYQNINKNKLNISHFLTKTQRIPRLDEIKFLRLRLGHTKLTHAHYISKSPIPSCPLCNLHPIKLDHVIASCPSITQLRLNPSPLATLTIPSHENITLLLKTLKIVNLFYSI